MISNVFHMYQMKHHIKEIAIHISMTKQKKNLTELIQLLEVSSSIFLFIFKWNYQFCFCFVFNI